MKFRTYLLRCPQYDLKYESKGRKGSDQNYNDLMSAQNRKYGRYAYVKTWEDYKKACQGLTNTHIWLEDE